MRWALGLRRAEVFLPEAIREEIEEEASSQVPNESGGVLLGYADRVNPRQIQVTHQIGPGPNAVHKTYRFDPDGKWQAQQIATVYIASGHMSTYLGDWHSHPLGSGQPSGLDRSTARRIALCKDARAPHPLTAILFGGPGKWKVAVYRREYGYLRQGRAIFE